MYSEELHLHGFPQWMGLNSETASWTTTLCWLKTSPPAPGFLEEPERLEIKGLKTHFNSKHKEINTSSTDVHYKDHKMESLHLLYDQK